MISQEYLTIAGVTVVIAGLGFSLWGALLLYRADFPRNDWILDAVLNSAQTPTYARIAPEGYQPGAEINEKLASARKIIAETSAYAKKSKQGLFIIFLGFVVQVAGNSLMIAAYFLFAS